VSYQRLVQIESMEGRDAPLLLMAALRDIDPTVELIYFGRWVESVNEMPVVDEHGGTVMRPEREIRYRVSGRWRLGAVRRTDERQRRGEAILAMEERRSIPNPRNVLLGKLLLQGFAQIEEYIGPDPSGLMLVNPGPDEYETTILEDFRARDAHWRRGEGDQVVEERLVAASDEERRRVAAANFNQYLATDGRAHYRREMRGRLLVGPGGSSGGRGKLILP